MNAHRRYVIVFFSALFVPLVALLLASFYIEPLEGELTRLGFYAERDFGWKLPQKKIRGDACMATGYSNYSDVLIVGDSFSANGVWQPFFRNMTGLTYSTLDIRKTSLHKLLEDEKYRKNPPKIMIVETVERELLYFFRDLNFDCNRPQANKLRVRIPAYGDKAFGEYFEESRKTFDPENIKLNYTAAVIFSEAIRKTFNRDTGDTKRFRLTKNNLFSNRKNGEILIYSGDMNKFSWKDIDVEKAICSVKGLQARVQSSGRTLFIFMLAPDKSSAYAEYIKDQLFSRFNNLPQSLVDAGINMPRLDLPLKAAIKNGEKDIYSPSGTHWSARGYELAAQGMADFIRQRAD